MAKLSGRRFALGLAFGTESVRALAVDCDSGEEAAQAVVPCSGGAITRNLPPDFALQNPENYIESSLEAVRGVLNDVPAARITGVSVDFTACTIPSTACSNAYEGPRTSHSRMMDTSLLHNHPSPAFPDSLQTVHAGSHIVISLSYRNRIPSYKRPKHPLSMHT